MSRYELGQWHIPVAADMEIRMVGVADTDGFVEQLLERERRQLDVERFPYWAEVWPASIALARWFCQRQPKASMGEVLELGCGLGLVGITLARLGSRVEATDFIEDALIFATHNAERNGVPQLFRVGYMDWRNPVGDCCPCVVGADVIYEKKNHPYLLRSLGALLAPGGYFYTSDPGREAARSFVGTLLDQGYSHTVETVRFSWKSLIQQVDIHAFRKPR